MVFRGNFPAKVDAQGRLKIPAAHRAILEEEYGPELFVTSVDGRRALIYPLSRWEEIEDKLLEPPRMQPAKVKFLRNTSFFGQVASLDKQGRVSIQAHLREAASIDGEVAVIGALHYLEVWNRDQVLKLIEEDPYTDADAAALAELGI